MGLRHTTAAENAPYPPTLGGERHTPPELGARGPFSPATKSHGNVCKIALRRLACNLRRQVSQL